MYHFILIDQEFTDHGFPETFNIFAQKQDGSWKIYGVEVPKDSLERSIADIQKNMKAGTWYAHGYNENELIVIFKEKIFRVKPEPSEWDEIVEYGKA